MTYTGTYTAPFSACTYTTTADLHEPVPAERETTYTGTYTTYTQQDLHARPPLYRGGGWVQTSIHTPKTTQGRTFVSTQPGTWHTPWCTQPRPTYWQGETEPMVSCRTCHRRAPRASAGDLEPIPEVEPPGKRPKSMEGLLAALRGPHRRGRGAWPTHKHRDRQRRSRQLADRRHRRNTRRNAQ